MFRSLMRLDRQVVRRIIYWTLELFVAGTLLFGVFFAGRVLYRLSLQVRINTLTLQREIKERQIKDDSTREQLDVIYRTLYAPPETPQQPRTPSAVEIWQRTRDKELRDRILALERWRLQQQER